MSRNSRHLVVLLSLVFFTTPALAQQASCLANRYLKDSFQSLTVTNDILFAQAPLDAGGTQDLFLDLYEPTSDPAISRGLLILAHGGSFDFGSRSDIEDLSRDFATRGYLVASIDYRLVAPNETDTLAFLDGVVKARSDMKAAIRFFVEDAAGANLYKVDTNYVFIGGTSAGAITAVNTGMWNSGDPTPAYLQTILDNNGGWDGNSSTNTQHGSDVRAVLNYSGATARSTFIDAADPPLYSVHDELDTMVRYDEGPQILDSGAVIHLAGSGSLKTQADLVGLENSLFTIWSSADHISYFYDNAPLYELPVIDGSSLFLHNIICDQVLAIDQQEIDVAVDGRVAHVRWQGDGGSQSSHYEVELRLDNELDWQSLVRVDVATGVSGDREYNHSVSDLPSGIHAIRIAEVALDGRRSYSSEQAIRVFSAGTDAIESLYPNPSSDRVSLALNLAQAGQVRLSVVDLLGREVLIARDSWTEAGYQSFELNTSALSVGHYVVLLRSRAGTSSRRMLIQR
ncbi:MAG: T9SS type A sorting domain-containing protein [Rhodothermales bacterium]|nr:T9SS type A sorting domain-containing protein [Rhodothermales bacterium]